MFDVMAFLDDYNIPYYTEGKNTQRGWVNVQCPFDCGDSSNHGGFNINTGHYNCWNCGHHWADQVVAKLLNVNWKEARNIINKYEKMVGLREEKKERKRRKPKELKWPISCGSITKRHREYLRNRGYIPEELEKDWKICGTQGRGQYGNRIIAPVYLDGVPVSFVGRDITNRHQLRYMTCEKKDELIFHKEILYGLDHVKERRAIIVEGIFDVWRIGKGTVATFGDAWTKEQVLFISERLDEVYILYDRGAERQAMELNSILRGLMDKVETLQLVGAKDPGELSPDDTLELREKFLKY